jgi:predicted nucleic acid-binding Zn ribbon protein
MKRVLTFVGIFLLGNGFLVSTARTQGPADPSTGLGTGQQVLENAELMEQLFGPSYADLTRAVTNKPADRKAWRTILDPARRLAELTNLLYTRRGKDYMAKPEWAAAADASRKALLAIGDAVKQLNYDVTRKRYEAAVETCNACHKKFEKEAPVVKPYVAEIKSEGK